MFQNIVFFFTVWLGGFLVLVGGLYFISRHNLWFKKYGLTLFLGLLVLGFSIYLVGYYFGNTLGDGGILHAVESTFLALFSSGRIMVMELDLGETGTLYTNEVYRTIYGIVMFAAMVVLAAMVLANVGGGIIGRVRFIFVRRMGTRKNIYFISGMSEDVLQLVEDIHDKDGHGLIFLLHARDEDEVGGQEIKDLENRAFQSGATRIAFSATRRPYFICSVIEKCRGETYLVCMQQEKWKNEAMVRQICVDARSIPHNRFHIYALYENAKSERISDEQVFAGYDLHWLQVEELSARGLLFLPEFLKVFPTEKCVNGRINRDIRLGITGFKTGTDILCKYLVCGISTAGMRVHLMIFGEKERTQRETAFFFQSNPALASAVEVEVIGIEPDTEQFYSYMLKNEKPLDALFCIGGHADENIACALRVSELWEKSGHNIPLFVQGENLLEDKTVLERAGVTVFGCRQQIFSYEVFIGEKLDAIAKRVHWYYHASFGHSEDADNLWKCASVYEKMSSRLLAIHIPWKVMCAGYELREGGISGAFCQALDANRTLETNLAIGEHMRWQACLVMEGWQCALPEELEKGQNKDTIRRRHACLVPWGELQEVSALYGKNYQELDRQLIRALEYIVCAAGYSLQRREIYEIN